MSKPPVRAHRQPTVGEPHYEVHAGASYVVSHIFPGLASGSAAAYLLRPGLTHSHMVFDVRSGGDAEVYLFENPTLSGSGTAIAPVNVNRPLSFGAGLRAWHGPTVTVSGTALFEGLQPGASGVDFPPGTVRPGTEWNLNTTGSAYLLFAVNASTTIENIGLNVGFYEEALW